MGRQLPSHRVVAGGDRRWFIDQDGGHPDRYVVQSKNAMFYCDASEVRADARPPVPAKRRHNAQ